MGGKGGGDGGISQADYLPGGRYHSVMQQMYPNLTSDPTSPFYDAPPPAPAAPAPAAPAPAAPAPTVDTPAPVVDTPAPAAPAPTGPAADVGSAVTQPAAADNPAPAGTGGLGAALGGSVTKPPKYWVGGVNNYNTADPASVRGTGKMKTSSST